MDRSSETPPSRAVTLAVLGLASMTIMANATVASSLPGLRAHYADVPHIDTLAGLIVTLPSLAIVLSAGLMGVLIDRWDRQKLLLLTAALYAIGGTSGLWAESLWGMLAGRLALGLGVAGTMNLGMTWASDLWQGPARARFLGWQGAAISLAGIVFMLAGGALASLHWRGAFAVYALIVPIATLAFLVLGPHARRIAAEKARPKAVASSADRFPWAAYAFIAPLAFLFQTAFYVTPTRLPFHLEALGVTSPLVVGALMAALVTVSAPVALMYGRIRARLSAMTIFGLSFFLIGLGFLAHATASDWHGVLMGSLIAGLGMGISMPNYTTWFMERVPASMRGRASGLLTTAFFLGQFASPLVSAPLVAWFGLAGTFAVVGTGLMTLGTGLWVVHALRPDPTALEA
ncbi:MFS transporter [Tabrizicola sp.]|uniref:MFS transporter n=1 Tax=Tabrizicola sp. TaxID=2005166 RepID=UPI001A4CAEEB|nr:MFS transporter [Tabrizicola sp.]MBL9061659.1 MFS transporter [Tabrizicola sp.]